MTRYYSTLLSSCTAVLLLLGASSIIAFQHQAIPSTSVRHLVSSKRASAAVPLPSLTALPKQRNASFSKSRLSSVSNDSSSDGESSAAPPVDVDALVKYASSILIQLALVIGTFQGLDAAVDATGIRIPFPILFVLFYALSLKSRVFNPLDNERPDMNKAVKNKGEASGGFHDRVMPSWTPPGVVFPIVWLLINAPLRAYSSSLIYQTTGHFADAAIMAFVLHLSVGDVWNTINNTEKRYGASVSAVVGVWLTAANAAWQYYGVNPLAGQLLGITCIWLTIAATLVTATWKLNPSANGSLDPLYPVQGEATTTEFAWFSKK